MWLEPAVIAQRYQVGHSEIGGISLLQQPTCEFVKIHVNNCRGGMPALQRGDRINQYQVHRRLGEGRSAEVYEVRDTNSPQDVRVSSPNA